MYSSKRTSLDAVAAAPRPQTSRTQTPTTLGVIRADELYTLDEFKRRTGLKDAALRSARRNGLIMLEGHGRKFIRGQDFFDHLARLQKAGPRSEGSSGA